MVEHLGVLKICLYSYSKPRKYVYDAISELYYSIYSLYKTLIFFLCLSLSLYYHTDDVIAKSGNDNEAYVLLPKVSFGFSVPFHWCPEACNEFDMKSVTI